eukprot:scaffold88013_cov21-Tisochrysis_lutea.AAC.2
MESVASQKVGQACSRSIAAVGAVEGSRNGRDRHAYILGPIGEPVIQQIVVCIYPRVQQGEHIEDGAASSHQTRCEPFCSTVSTDMPFYIVWTMQNLMLGKRVTGGNTEDDSANTWLKVGSHHDSMSLFAELTLCIQQMCMGHRTQ